MRQYVSKLLLVAAVLTGATWCDRAPDGPSEGAPSEDVGKSDFFGPEDGPSVFRPGNRYGWGGDDDFLDGVLPRFAKRCATCHGCTDSPCQLKLTSYESIARGSNEANIFANRVSTLEMTRMQDGRVVDGQGMVDHQATEANWRNRGFYSVTNYGQNSIMYRLLDDAHQLTPEGGLSQAYELFDQGLRTREFDCLGPEAAGPEGPREEDLAPRAMPFGCPGIEDEHFDVLAQWLEEGASGPTAEAEAILATPLSPELIDRWERFFNPEDFQGQLVARYLYEHLFFARLHFPEAPGDYYEIVRSWTPPGEPIQEIVTQFPSDNPRLAEGAPPSAVQNPTVYYRFKYTAVVVYKNHMTWPLDDQVMARWKELFWQSDWGQVQVGPPNYENDNPFEYFEAIPSLSRATFIVESGYRIIDAIVRGDVCVGSRATYAVRDHFWVFFLRPDADPSARDPKLGRNDWFHLDPGSFHVQREWTYLAAYEKRLRELHPEGLSLEHIWDGEGSNPNAWLTVLRHEKSASVHHGGFAGQPATCWVLNYSNIERLYYGLVAQYNAWGNVPHKIETWRYMSFIRTEGEDLFISLLPEEYRHEIRDQWTSGFGGRLHEAFFGLESDGRPSQVSVDSENPLDSLVHQVADRMSPTIRGPEDLINVPSEPFEPLPSSLDTLADFEQGLATLTDWRAPFARYLPNVTLVRIGGEAGWLYSLVANRGYQSHYMVLLKDLARDPEQDRLSVSRGLVGAYPQLFVDVPWEQASTFLEQIRGIDSDASFQRLLREHAGGNPEPGVTYIRRDSQEFWPFFDWLHAWAVADNPQDAGIADVSEYVWPDRAKAGRPAADDEAEPNDREETATPLPFGRKSFVLCANEDWFLLDVPTGGRLAVEVAFDQEEGSMDAFLTGPGIGRDNGRRSDNYVAFADRVAPGKYQLQVRHDWLNRRCQHYTVWASLHPEQ